jgi:sugar lactone lactonase YvrE
MNGKFKGKPFAQSFEYLGGMFSKDEVFDAVLDQKWAPRPELSAGGSGGPIYIPQNIPESISTGTFVVSRTGIFMRETGTSLFSCSATQVFEYSLSTAWLPTTLNTTPVQTATFSGTDSSISDLFFSPDGTSMYLLGQTNDKLYQFSLGTAWLLSSATLVTDFLLPSGEGTPSGFCFSDNGDEIYVTGTTLDAVYQISLGTPWDLSTASYTPPPNTTLNQRTTLTTFLGADFNAGGTVLTGPYFSNRCYANTAVLPTANEITSVKYKHLFLRTSATGPYPRYQSFAGVTSKPDGTAIYIVDRTGRQLHEFPLSTAWDFATESGYSTITNNLSDFSATVDVAYSSDGYRAFLLQDLSTTLVRQALLRTPWTLSSAYDTSITVSSTESGPAALRFKPDGTAYYIVGGSLDRILQYSLSTAWDLSTASFFQQSNITVGATPNGMEFSLDGSIVYVSDNTGDQIRQYALGTAWDVNTLSLTNTLAVGSVTGAIPSGLAISSDGQYLQVVDGATTGTFAYNYATLYMSTAYDLSTAVLATDRYFNPSSLNGAISSTGYLDSGNKVRIRSGTVDIIFDLATPYNINTIKFSGSLLNDTAMNAFIWNPDGTGGYAVGQTGDLVYQYEAIVPYKASTLKFVRQFSTAAQEITPTGVLFNSDGTQMYVVGQSADAIQAYNLGTAYDISTATISSSFSVAGQSTTPASMNWADSGQKLVLGSNTNVFLYDAGTAYDATTLTYSGVSFNINTQISATNGTYSVHFSSDGLTAFVTDYAFGYFTQVDLDTAYALSSQKTFLNATATIGTTGGGEVVWANSGSNFYIADQSTSFDIENYSVTTPYTFAGASAANFSTNFGAVINAFALRDDGTSVYVSYGTNASLFKRNLATAWDISGATTNNETLSGLGGPPLGVAFKPDGTRLYMMLGTSSVYPSSVVEYTLSTPWQISSGATVSSVFAFKTEFPTTAPTDFLMSEDGTKFYLWISSAAPVVYQYSLSTAWDLSTAYTSVSRYVPLSGNNFLQDPAATAISPDGKILYVLSKFTTGTSSVRTVYYNLRTPFSVASAELLGTSEPFGGNTVLVPAGISLANDGKYLYSSLTTSATGLNFSIVPHAVVDGSVVSLPAPIPTSTSIPLKTLSVSATDATPVAFTFKPDGTRLFVVGTTSDRIGTYDLSTPWDISSASFVSNTSISDIRIPDSLWFSQNGKTLIVYSNDQNRLFQFSLGTAWDPTTLSYVGISIPLWNGDPSAALPSVSSGAVIDNDGRYMWMLSNAPAGNTRQIYGYYFERLGDVSSIRLAYSFYTQQSGSFAPSLATQYGFRLSSDGLRAFAVVDGIDGVIQFDLPGPFVLTPPSATNHREYLVAGDTLPTGVGFSGSGDKMYVSGDTANTVREFNLSTPWNVITGTFVRAFSVSAETTTPRNTFFKPDGTIMFLASGITPASRVFAYTLPTPWSLDGATLLATFDGSGVLSGSVNDVFITPDGTSMLLFGWIGSDVINRALVRYTLGTPWDITTASFVETTSLNSTLPKQTQSGTTVTGIAFSPNGETLFFSTEWGTTAAFTGLALRTPYVPSSSIADFANVGFLLRFSTETLPAINGKLSMSPNGKKLFYAQIGSGTLYPILSYDMSPPWRVASAQRTANNFYVNYTGTPANTAVQEVQVSGDNTQLYVIDSGSDSITQFDLTAYQST